MRVIISSQPDLSGGGVSQELEVELVLMPLLPARLRAEGGGEVEGGDYARGKAGGELQVGGEHTVEVPDFARQTCGGETGGRG